MDTFTLGYDSPSIRIEELGTAPSARHYFVDDELDGFGGDVYVLDFDDTDHPYPYCVILFSSEQGWPGYLYDPDVCLEGVSHETAIRLALVAYRARYADLIRVLRATKLNAAGA